MPIELSAPTTPVLGHSHLITMSVAPKAGHPQHDYIMAQAYELAQALNIITEGYDAYSDFVPALFPEAPADRVIDVTIFFNTLYYLDNLFGEDTLAAERQDLKPALEGLQQLWLTGKPDTSVPPILKQLYGGMLAFRERLVAKVHPAFFKSLTHKLFLHLQHALHPADFTTVGGYISSRRWTGGMDATLALYDYVYENYLPDSLLVDHPYFTRMQYVVNLHPTLSNDIFSYPAERHSRYNLINVLQETQAAASLEEAVFQAIELVNAYDREFKELYEQRQEVIGSL
ncbi:MAG TPA: hypothetical protein DCP28_36840, partial [Cytophagales bacterium]|nr:hypothetical protein [Cytophagales bacterium]